MDFVNVKWIKKGWSKLADLGCLQKQKDIQQPTFRCQSKPALRFLHRHYVEVKLKSKRS